jgi:hypothetical protein
MAYFLGRDCSVYITTEDTQAESYAGVSAAGAVGFNATSGTAGAFNFAVPLGTGAAGTAEADITGVDLSIGAVDEDITYVGFRNITKAEIKKETTVSITRKKNDITWDAIFNNGGRQGCANSSEVSSLQEPTIDTGYRIHVVLSGSTDVFSVRGCCVQGHTVSINADGTSEETMEFMTYITPKVTNAAVVTDLTAAEL